MAHAHWKMSIDHQKRLITLNNNVVFHALQTDKICKVRKEDPHLSIALKTDESLFIENMK